MTINELHELQAYFHLTGNPALFKQALSPPSCGGGDVFNSLAIEGDGILDSALIKLFQNQGIHNAGEITKKKQQFHNERTLSELGIKFLKLHRFFCPIDRNYQIQKSDIKETIESLIAAAFRENGTSITDKIIEDFYYTAMENEMMDIDYISELQMQLQKELNNPLLQWSEPIQVGGPPHLPIWAITLRIEFRSMKHSITSDPFSNLKLAKRDAARKLLMKIMNTSLPSMRQITIPQKQEVMKKPSQALFQREIIFSKSDLNENTEGSMKISVETGKYLPEWAMEKARKNPFSMLIILSTILPDEIRGSSWNATTEIGELVLMHMQIGSENFFDVGFGPSRSQARKNVALKLIADCHLFDWLAQHHAKTIK